MKRQSRRATVLTLLAAFYLPLSLVTGIFGMNLKEFDDAKPSVALCFEALFAVIAVTAFFYGLYRYLPLVCGPL
jgi:Mg2+ and Co2+ transporter CorA